MCEGGRRHAVIAIKRAFPWAERRGALAARPLTAGRAKRRPRVLRSAEAAEILAATRDR